MKQTIGLPIVGCIAVALCFGLTTASTEANLGKALTDSQMSEMFGGGWVTCGDKDCDTQSGSCPGGDTCAPDDSGNLCTICASGNGQKCGTPAGAGWQCVDTTKSCNGDKGLCTDGTCEKHASPSPTPSCGSRPDC